MSEAPERIWLTSFVKDQYGARLGHGTISDLDHSSNPDYPEYTRTDTIPDPAAIWREAMEAALEEVNRHSCVDVGTRTKFMADWIADDIRAIPNPYEVKK